MTSRRARAALLSSGVLAWACAYYNGLYNANHLAADAARAHREGRPAEARSLWEQAALRAESVVIRHPRSRYRDAALLLQGESLRDAGACVRAVEPLALLADSARGRADGVRASLVLGECYVELGEPGQARRTLTPLVGDPDPSVRRPARLWRARAALAEGDAQAALSDLEPLDQDADALFARASALAMLARIDEAASLLARATLPFDESQWRAAVDAVGRSGPGPASQLTDQLVQRPDISGGARARLLLRDADRWDAVGDQARVASRLRQAAAAAPDSADGRLAATRVAVASLRTLTTRETLEAASTELSRVSDDGGPAARIAQAALATLRRITAARESPQADLRLFLAAEAVGDAFGAGPLAESLFLEVVRDHPASPVAPKALLAAAHMDPLAADSLIALVRVRYPESPYWLATQGRDAPGFSAIEDSLLGARPASSGDEEARQRPVSPGKGVPEP